jgi:hypothetical protein
MIDDEYLTVSKCKHINENGEAYKSYSLMVGSLKRRGKCYFNEKEFTLGLN